MISIQRHTAEKLILRFRGPADQYGFKAGETSMVFLPHASFGVSGGYLQIFGAAAMVIAMSEILSITFIPAEGQKMAESLIAVE